MTRIGSLFSGAGGLDLAVEQVFGGTTAWHCENDPAASKVLTSHWPNTPNHTDVTTADWSTVEPVDVLCGGWPCQPFSKAGLKRGILDERALWPHVARAIRDLRPRIVVLENVSTVLRAGEFDRVAADLAETGYRFGWICLRACDIGAPHNRERTFIVGHVKHAELPTTPSPALHDNTKTLLLSTPQARDSKGVPTDGFNDKSLPRDILHLVDSWGKWDAAVNRWQKLTRPAPNATIPGLHGHKRPRLNPQFAEWLMGWPAGWVTDVDGLTRKDVLRIIGNGVVTQQAHAAILHVINETRSAAA